MCLGWFSKSKLGKPSPLVDVEYTELMSTLRAELGESCVIYIYDSKYKLTSLTEYARFISQDDTDKESYISEYLDCDDFSIRLYGQFSIKHWSSLPFGILISNTPMFTYPHAVNIFVDDNLDVWIVEPQNDNISKLPSNWEPLMVVI